MEEEAGAVTSIEELQKLKFGELKKRLSSLGLDISGRKADLIERLHSYFLSTQETQQHSTEEDLSVQETESQQQIFNEVVNDGAEDVVPKATRTVDYVIDWVRGHLGTLGKAFAALAFLSASLGVILMTIHFTFSIIYKWLSLPLQDPESQLGAGLAGTVVMAVGIRYYWSWSDIFVGICVAALLGGCIVSGSYKLYSLQVLQVCPQVNLSAG